MDAVGLLHNAARHYCIRRAAAWHQQYAELGASGRQRTTKRAGAWDYTEEAYGIFPRYRILAAIQRDVEQFVPADFHNADELRSILAVAGETAQVESVKFPNPISFRAIEDERRQFVQFVYSTSAADQLRLPVLPFRRVLKEDEHNDRYAAFSRHWGRWYGGYVSEAAAGERIPAAGALTLHEQAMQEPGAYEHLRRLLRMHGMTRIIELREWGDGCEIDVPAASFSYNGAEGFWTSGNMTWMVYASHEASITFGGLWLVDGMRASLACFDHYLYRGWDLAMYDMPPGAGP